MWSLMMLILLCALGIATRVLSALLGLGGGIFLMPVLTVFFHLPIRTAIATSLIGVIATSTGAALVEKPERGADVELAMRLESVTAAGAVAGSWMAAHAGTRALSWLFALVVFASAAYLVFKAKRMHRGSQAEEMFRSSYKVRHWAAGLSGSTFAGLLSGFLGVGGGFVKVPIMYALMEVPLGIATATSNFMGGITAAASVFIYYGRGDVHPLVVAPTALGVLFGAALGVQLAPRLKADWLRSALILLLLLMGAQMITHGLQH